MQEQENVNETSAPERDKTTLEEVSKLMAEAMLGEQHLNETINTLRDMIANLYSTLTMISHEAAQDLLDRLNSEDVLEGINKMRSSQETRKIKWAGNALEKLKSNFVEIE